MTVLGVWLALTAAGVFVVGWNQHTARVVRDALTKGGPLHVEARSELQRHRLILVVMLLHLAAGVTALASQMIDTRWGRVVPLVLIVAEFVLVAASVRERRRR